MSDLSVFERRVLSSLSRKVHARLAKAALDDVPAEAFGDPEQIADAMLAALPGGHVYDDISGPFYDTNGLTKWLGITRQALHQRVSNHSLLACPTDDGGLVYPTWQFHDDGTTIPGLAPVLAVLASGSDDPWMHALWMRAPSSALDDHRPSDWLRAGRDPSTVVALAEDAAQRWRR